MFIGIAFMLYTLVIILSVIVGTIQTSNMPLFIFRIALGFITWLILGLIAIGIL